LRNINGKSIGNKPPNPKRFNVLSSSVILYFILVFWMFDEARISPG